MFPIIQMLDSHNFRLETIDIKENKWFKSAQKSLVKVKESKQFSRPTKNIIFFLGDGMGISTITAARYVDSVCFISQFIFSEL